ncbi:MAG: UDP-2,4-diacetamido-2,4,6-trideoxy-beta-L-altropyranose hydrolase [Pseudoalteromonas sp.]
MKVFFRTDASKKIGSGHVYRCISLAQALTKLQYTCIFICREFEGHSIDFIRTKGFECRILASSLSNFHQAEITAVEPALKHSDWLNATQQQDASATLQTLHTDEVKHTDWIVVDHFALGAFWERILATKLGCHIAVLDGQADRVHFSDVLIDPSLCTNPEKWQSFIQPHTRLYLGFPYIPLAPAFFEQQSHARIRNKVRNVLIAFGGVDQYNYTQCALEALLALQPCLFTITVVIGQHYPFKDALVELCSRRGVTLKSNVSDMEQLMLQADLAIGAGGTMSWERCMLYLPTIVTTIADNQLKQVECLVSKGVAIKVSSDLTQYADKLKEALNTLLKNEQCLSSMSKQAMNLVLKESNQVWLDVFTE